MITNPKNINHYIHDDGHLTHFTSCLGLEVWCSGGVKFMYEYVGGGGVVPNNQGKPDAFTLIVLELAGHYINFLVIQKFTHVRF